MDDEQPRRTWTAPVIGLCAALTLLVAAGVMLVWPHLGGGGGATRDNAPGAGAVTTAPARLAPDLETLVASLGDEPISPQRLRAALAELESYNELLERLQAVTAKAAIKENARLEAERRLKTANENLEKANARLVEHQAQLAAAQVDIMNLQREIRDLKAMHVFPPASRPAEPTPGTKPAPSPPAIRATVVMVGQDGDHITVRLDAGTDRGIIAGMRFILYGGGQYKGDALIRRVTERSATGVLTLVGEERPKPGDQATTRLTGG